MRIFGDTFEYLLFNFQLQQPPLGLSAIGKANEFTTSSDNAVAGDDEQQGILVAGHAHGAACSGIAYGGTYLLLLPPREGQGGVPLPALRGGGVVVAEIIAALYLCIVSVCWCRNILALPLHQENETKDL